MFKALDVCPSFSKSDHVFAHTARKELLFRVFKWYVRSGHGCGHPERYQKMYVIDRTDCNSLSVCPLSIMRLFDCPLRYIREASQLCGMGESRGIVRPPPRPRGAGAGKAVPPPQHQAAGSCRGQAWRSLLQVWLLGVPSCHLVRVCCWYETRTPRIVLFSEVSPLFVSSPRRNTSHKP